MSIGTALRCSKRMPKSRPRPASSIGQQKQLQKMLFCRSALGSNSLSEGRVGRAGKDSRLHFLATSCNPFQISPLGLTALLLCPAEAGVAADEVPAPKN